MRRPWFTATAPGAEEQERWKHMRGKVLLCRRGADATDPDKDPWADPGCVYHLDREDAVALYESLGVALGVAAGRCEPGPLLEGYPTHRTAAGSWFVRGEHCCAWGPAYAPDACSEAWG